MKKEIAVRMAVCGFICVCFSIICNHMPKLISSVYSSIFQTVNLSVFMFVVGLFICEIIIMKRLAKNKKIYYVCFAVTFMISTVMLFNGHSSLEDKLMPDSNTTLLNRMVAGLDLPRGVFMQYYFDDKNVVITDEVNNHREEYPFIFELSVSPQKILVDEEIMISKELEERIFSYPYYVSDPEYFDDDPFFYVVDEYWESTGNIRLVHADDKYIFCSQELLNDVQDYVEPSNAFLTSESNDAVSVLCEIVQDRPYKKFKQVIIMLLLLTSGLLITLPLWGNDYPILAFFMGLPVAAAGVCIYGTVLMILNIPFNLYSILVGSILLIGIWVFRNRYAYRTLNYSLFSNLMLIAIGVVVLLVYSEVCYTTHDSIVKCAMGYRLAKFGTFRDILRYAEPYGMLEPMVMSIGYMARCDLLYTFYPLMLISGIGIMCAGINYINDKKESSISMLVLGGGIILLLSNYDFLLSGFYVMAHGPIAVYILISVVFIIMKRRINIQGFEYVMLLAATTILLTRVEGAVYILFILIASMGIENEYLRMKKANIMMVIITIIWNGYQMIFIGRNADPFFWRPDRGILLIGASIATLVVTLLMNRQWKFLSYIKKNYFSLLMAAIVGGTVFASVFVKRGIASVNLAVYLSHFSNSLENDTNSAAFWVFIFLLCPMILNMKNETKKYAITIVLGYILLTYFTFLFRSGGLTDMPLRLGYYDSSRRVIVQIMPTTIWLFASCMGDKLQLLKETDI